MSDKLKRIGQLVELADRRSKHAIQTHASSAAILEYSDQRERKACLQKMKVTESTDYAAKNRKGAGERRLRKYVIQPTPAIAEIVN